MAGTKQKILRCPICRTIVPLDDPKVPFCSDRCRVIDLGKWASGAYRISSPILDPELLEDIDEATLRRTQQEHDADDER
jgi:endogenous inhibitor of DNA gyrase (YacG/DUF329 family)